MEEVNHVGRALAPALRRQVRSRSPSVYGELDQAGEDLEYLPGVPVLTFGASPSPLEREKTRMRQRLLELRALRDEGVIEIEDYHARVQRVLAEGGL